MRSSRFAAYLVAAAVAFGAADVAQAQARIRIVPCQSNCWGGPSPTDSMTPVVNLLLAKAQALTRLLPPDLAIDVLIDGSDDFHYRARPNQPHLITIGVHALAELHNSWANAYANDSQGRTEEAFGAIVEWTFYHEVGHALLERAGQAQSHLSNDDPNHERMADRFATVAMMFSNRDAARRANFASQGISRMRLGAVQQASAGEEGVRHAHAPRAAQRKEVGRRRGVDGILGVHAPTPYRAWVVRCYVWGAGLMADPGVLTSVGPGGQQQNDHCNERDFNNAILELRQYWPGLPQLPLNAVTRYNPQTGQLYDPRSGRTY